jgi:hypothetical protein
MRSAQDDDFVVSSEEKHRPCGTHFAFGSHAHIYLYSFRPELLSRPSAIHDLTVTS